MPLRIETVYNQDATKLLRGGYEINEIIFADESVPDIEIRMPGPKKRLVFRGDPSTVENGTVIHEFDNVDPIISLSGKLVGYVVELVGTFNVKDPQNPTHDIQKMVAFLALRTDDGRVLVDSLWDAEAMTKALESLGIRNKRIRQTGKITRPDIKDLPQPPPTEDEAPDLFADMK